MKDIGSIFHGARITQMGLGLLGRGVGDAEYLSKYGAKLVVTDLKSEEELQQSVSSLTEWHGITYHLGGHDLTDFEDRDLILKGAGVPLSSDCIAHARSRRVPVDMSASLFARVSHIPMIGVTGTRGKSTVTHLIHSILQHDSRDVILGGNVRGVSNLSLLDSVTTKSIGVFELDSWQCQGLGEMHSLNVSRAQQGPLSPNVSVLTTLMPDHMNYYNGDMVTYISDKAQIFLHQKEDDVFVLGRQAVPLLAEYKNDIRSHVIVADETDVPPSWKLQLYGEHNRYNAGVAIATARAFGVDDDVIQSVIESSVSLPGRLEERREVNGIRFFNDTNATTPDATAAALAALDPDGKKNIVLIAGGADKGLDADILLKVAEKHAKHVVFLKGTGTGKLTLHKVDLDTQTVDTLQQAVLAAVAKAEAGDIVLFSPGFSSFGMFVNEFDRGDQFNALVAHL